MASEPDITTGCTRRSPLHFPDPLLTAREAAEYRRQGLSTFWRDVARGTAPKPVYVSPGAPRWRLSELDAAIAAGIRKGAHHA
ncbi:MAG: helix-turn-helix transcriptional regulator [Alphaproteobacteria bacterium]